MLKNFIGAVLIIFLVVLTACESPLQSTEKYSVTYSGNGNTSGQVPVDSNNYEAGATVTVSSKGTLAKTGYTFSGWNTLADGSGTDRAVGTSFVIGSANITLYAKWTLTPTYTVTYSGNGNTSGQVPVDSNNYEAGATVIVALSGSLTKTGYLFDSWNTTSNGSGTIILEGATVTMAASNMILYVKWISNGIITPTFNKVFSGTTNLVFDSFVLPAGLYKIEVNTTGFFQLFDVGNNKTLYNLFSGQAINAETFIKSNGGSYTFKTGNTSSNWTVAFSNLDFTDPKPISNITTISANVPKILGPFLMELVMYKVTMKTNGFFQLFPINPVTGVEESYIFNEFSGNYGSQNTYTPTNRIMLFRTANISDTYQVDFTKM